MRMRWTTLVVWVCVAVARADDGWTLTTRDFKNETVTPVSIDASRLTVKAADGSTRDVPLTSLVQLIGPARSSTPTGLTLWVAGGQRLVGTPRRIDGANLIWFTAGVGEVAVPLESLLGVLRDRGANDGLNDARAEDVARLTTGDSVRGILTEATDDTLVFTPATGDGVRVAMANVVSVLFASPPGGRKSLPPPPFLVRIAGGSVIACERVTLADDSLSLRTVSGSTTNVDLAQIEAIEHTGGPVAWLSSRGPDASVHTPYLDGEFPARMDGNVTGGPIRFGGVAYARGIGVHSRSRLDFTLRPGDARFRTRYAIDGNAPRADVDVRVLLDGKPVHERKNFRVGTLSPLVELEVIGAKTLTLEVDYGAGYDVQDRLNWIEPAFVRDVE